MHFGDVIDDDGFRQNVGIMLLNSAGQLFWGRRVGQDSWQFPQGGIHRDETPEQALYRELHEETGLAAHDVELLGATGPWLRYRIPRRFLRRGRNACVGQKQIWYLLRLASDESRICLNAAPTPEFDRWCWVDYWAPLAQIVNFKREVYRSALTEFETLARPCAAAPGLVREQRA